MLLLSRPPPLSPCNFKAPKSIEHRIVVKQKLKTPLSTNTPGKYLSLLLVPQHRKHACSFFHYTEERIYSVVLLKYLSSSNHSIEPLLPLYRLYKQNNKISLILLYRFCFWASINGIIWFLQISPTS